MRAIRHRAGARGAHRAPWQLWPPARARRTHPRSEPPGRTRSRRVGLRHDHVGRPPCRPPLAPSVACSRTRPAQRWHDEPVGRGRGRLRDATDQGAAASWGVTEKGWPVDDDGLTYERFVTDRAATLLRYGYVLTGNAHDAADLVQEGLLRLRTAWPRVVRKDDPEGYTRAIMARLHISAWRRRRRERLVREVPEGGYVDRGLEQTERDPRLWRALAALPRRQRAVLVLRYYEDLPDEEIAELLDISRGTVRSQAARALDKLRADWRPSLTQAVGAHHDR
ncbi:SigE family RNA polymerase sigma factor [Actinomadura nitritigenes]|uniref:SigE family RNA polymerase sigma factor n=1 Tax=Actinomadura nitritigenes TaxID=134602 RepID=A0ABS3RB87_9ACTN|nr:SigE family RNA polymerase sigma factor [Actinomadura nitritigenes]